MTRSTSIVLASFLLLACEAAPTLGNPCTTASTCGEPLVCRLGRCRSECAASRDCPAGARCLLDEAGLGACSIEVDDRCESGGTSCPSGLTCLGGRCVNTCEDAADCPSDGECREALGTGFSFCFAPEREDAGVPSDDGASDAAQDPDAFVALDAGPRCTGAGCSVVDVCMGEKFTCAVRADHGVYCWGSNHFGELGDGSGDDTPNDHASTCMGVDCSTTPVRVLRAGGAPLDADAIACSAGTACARESSTGDVVCWGDGNNGELAGITRSARARAIFSLPRSPLTLTGGRAFFCASYALGTDARCWGDQSKGQFGLPMSSRDNPALTPHWNDQTLAVGGTATCSLDADGAVWCAGSNLYGEIGPNGALDAVQYGPVGVPLPDGAEVTSLVSADSVACALVDGMATCWGANVVGSLGRDVGTTCTDRDEPCDRMPAAVTGDASFDVLWAEGFTGRVCGRRGDAVWCWGSYSEIGCEPGNTCRVPRAYAELAGATRVVSSTRSSCAILADGSLICGGGNAFGQLGRGTTSGTNELEPFVSVCVDDGC